MKKKDNRKFRKVVGNIRRAERDVDKVLRAAKLKRCERSEFWEGTGFLEIIFGIVMVIGALVCAAIPILSILAS